MMKKEETVSDMGDLILDKNRMIEVISDLSKLQNISSVKNKINETVGSLTSKKDKSSLFKINKRGETIEYNKQVLLANLKQISDSQTLERAKHYIERLRKSVEEVKTSKINDLNLNRWKEYTDLLTDSLWHWPKRDNSGVHMAGYWGNFIPQIPNQTLRRYTKKGDWVLDAFLGSGTTLIECRKLGRNGLGIELNPAVAKESEKLISKEQNKFNVITSVRTGDSRKILKSELLKGLPADKFQLIMLHPPYHDIIKFSKRPEDLSNAGSLNNFLEMFGGVVDNVSPLLEKNRYLVLVIGDKYSKGEWIPLAHLTAMEIMKRGFTLKSTIVKNIEKTVAKRNQEDLWRYRALAGGFYVFKHEYVMIFKKEDTVRMIDKVIGR